jgi:hypothetical protein
MSRKQQQLESDLLAWIEGELDAAREPAVLAAIESDAELAQRVRAMRADRDVVRSLGDVSAPAGLLDEVERVLERGLLLGLTEGEPEIVRVSQVRPARDDGVLGRLLFGSPCPRLALAAAVLIVVGIGTYLAATNLGRSYAPNRPVRSIASGDSGGEGGTDPGGVIDVAPEVDKPVEVAIAPPDDVPVDPTAADTEDGSQPADMELARAIEANRAELVRRRAARAAALAAEGRLLITVHVDDAEGRGGGWDEKLDALADRTHRSSGNWRFAGPASKQLASELRATRFRYPELVPGMPTAPIGPLLASATEPSGMVRVIPAERVTRPVGPRVVDVRLIDLRAQPETLISVLSELALSLDGRVEFEATDMTVPTEPVLDPSAVLWWGGSSADWARRVNVPVVVELDRP